jgi:hypothetical protein
MRLLPLLLLRPHRMMPAHTTASTGTPQLTLAGTNLLNSQTVAIKFVSRSLHGGGTGHSSNSSTCSEPSARAQGFC